MYYTQRGEEGRAEEWRRKGVYLFMPNDGNGRATLLVDISCCWLEAGVWGKRRQAGGVGGGGGMYVACIEYAAYVT